MFVLSKNQNVVYGPKLWDKLQWQQRLYTLFDIDYPMPFINNGDNPISINEEITIYPVIFREPTSMDRRTQMKDGPYYEFNETHAIQYWEVVDKNLDAAKGDAIEFYRDLRSIGIERGNFFTIGDEEYLISGSVEERMIYSTALPGWWRMKKKIAPSTMTADQKANASDAALAAGIYDYSLETVWVDLTQEDLDNINQHQKDWVRLCFDLEKQAIDNVNACTSLEEIAALEHYSEIRNLEGLY